MFAISSKHYLLGILSQTPSRRPGMTVKDIQHTKPMMTIEMTTATQTLLQS